MTAPDGWSSVHIDVDGLDLHAFERRGSGDPVVLLHGAGGNALALAAVAAAFEPRTVLLLDMPGHGLSATPPRWDLDYVARLVATAAKTRLGNAAAIWGGHSWGGKIAGLVASAEPSLCRALVLLDPSPSAAVPVDIADFVEQNFSAELQPRPSCAAAVEAARGVAQWQPWHEDTAAAVRHGLAEREAGSWALRPSREDLVALCTAVLHTDATDELAAAAAAAPTLLLVASESLPWQQVTNMLAYAEARTEEISGHHWIAQCNRTAVIAAIQAWLRHPDAGG